MSTATSFAELYKRLKECNDQVREDIFVNVSGTKL